MGHVSDELLLLLLCGSLAGVCWGCSACCHCQSTSYMKYMDCYDYDCCSAMLWITFAPVSDEASDYFDGENGF